MYRLRCKLYRVDSFSSSDFHEADHLARCACVGQAFAVGREYHPAGALILSELAEHPARGHVPKAHLTINPGSRQGLAVRRIGKTETCRRQNTRIIFISYAEQFLTGVRSPDVH